MLLEPDPEGPEPVSDPVEAGAGPGVGAVSGASGAVGGDGGAVGESGGTEAVGAAPGDGGQVVGDGGGWADHERRLAAVNGRLHVLQAEQVELISEALREGWWAGAGVRSPEHWVAWQCGVSPAHARQLVRVARRIVELPVIAGAFAEGRLSGDQVAVLARHTPPERDEEVAGFAPDMSVTQLGRVLRTAPEPSPPPDDTIDGAEEPGEPEAAKEEQRRRFNVFADEESGGWRLGGWLPLDEGQRLRTVLDEIIGDLIRAGEGDPGRCDGQGRVSTADALVEMVERAAGFNGRVDSSSRFLSVLHVAVDSDRVALLEGRPLPDSLRRLVACDGRVQPVFDLDGVTPVALGRAERTVPERVRRLIEGRDLGCRVPGCGVTRVEVHHIWHWEDGGPTDPDNLCCLCHRHHRLHHQGDLGITGDPTRPDGLTFTNRHGRRLNPGPTVRPPPTGPPPTNGHTRRNGAGPDAGAEPGDGTGPGPGAGTGPDRSATNETGTGAKREPEAEPDAEPSATADAGPEPYRHPSGERIDARWFAWRAVTRRAARPADEGQRSGSGRRSLDSDGTGPGHAPDPPDEVGPRGAADPAA